MLQLSFFCICRSEGKSARHGYMGHLIDIANLIAHLCTVNSLGQFLNETIPDVYEQFQKFKDTTLQEINRTQETLLVSFVYGITFRCYWKTKKMWCRVVLIQILLMRIVTNMEIYHFLNQLYCNSRYVNQLNCILCLVIYQKFIDFCPLSDTAIKSTNDRNLQFQRWWF